MSLFLISPYRHPHHRHVTLEGSTKSVVADGKDIMACKVCGVDNERSFNGEVAIHFPGLAGLEKPIVWVFPKLLVCLQCGFSEFTVPERELSVLVHGKVVPGAVVSSGAGSKKKQELKRISLTDVVLVGI